MPIKNIVKEVVVLVGLSVITAFVYNAFHEKGIAYFGEWDTSKGVISAKSKTDTVSHDLEIHDLETAKALYDSEAVFVDARSEDDYQEGHVKGAISLPAWEYLSHIEAFRNTVPLEMTIVTYCSGRECDDSHDLAQQLLMEGYVDVQVFIDGYPAWQEGGLPTSVNGE